MITAKTAGDSSKVNVRGAVRVADFNDSFVGESATSAYSTVLTGSHELGLVDAFDLSILANAAYHLGAGAGIVGRNFTRSAWVDLSN